MRKIRFSVTLTLDRDVPADVLANAKKQAMADAPDTFDPDDFILPAALQGMGATVVAVKHDFEEVPDYLSSHIWGTAVDLSPEQAAVYAAALQAVSFAPVPEGHPVLSWKDLQDILAKKAKGAA